MTGENTGDNPRRVLLKLSGEAFGGGKVGIDTSVIRRIAEEIVPAVQQGVQVAIVVGGGNFFRACSPPSPWVRSPSRTFRSRPFVIWRRVVS